jgi:transcriptional regulator with XRE-family HTH domain
MKGRETPVGQEPDAVTFGNAVAQRRTKAHISQDDLAQRAGVSRSTLQAMEAGRRTGKTSRRLVAEALGATVDELFGRGQTHEFKIYRPEDGKLLLTVLSDEPLSPEQQARFVRAAFEGGA